MKNKFFSALIIIFSLIILKYILPTNNIFLSFALLIILAYFLGQIFDLIKLPEISAYIVVGILLGPNFFSFFTFSQSESLKVIDMLALTTIAFMVGKELSISKIKKDFKRILILTIIIIFITFFLQFLTIYFTFPIIGKKFFINSQKISFIALLFAFLALAKSPLTTIALMKETNTYTKTAIHLLVITVLKDVIVLILFTVFMGINVYNEGNKAILFISWNLLGSFILGGMIAIIIVLFLKKIIYYSNLLMLFLTIGIVIISKKFHFEPLIIGMTVGFIIENFSDKGDLFLSGIEDYSTLIFILFFTVRGMNLNIKLLKIMSLIAIIYTITRVLYTYLALMVGSIMLKFDKNLYKYGWMGFINQSGVTIALAIIIEKYFPELTYISEIAIAMVILTDLLAPPLFKYALIKMKKVEN